MLISFNWLRELTGTKSNPQQLRDRLTMVGLAIDAVDQHDHDAVLDVEVPSNRPDCLSHIGVAREVAVIEQLKVNEPAGNPPPVSGHATDLTGVEIIDTDLCPRYVARLVQGVRIGPSPTWLVKKLESIGQRPINNVADITNYVLHELGQPLHAFDFHKLAGRRIVVRRAAAGERLRTLDGVERELTPDMLVIADAEKPVAMAGIMGGEESEISATTTEVLIESAYFNPDSIRRTARTLGMDTEASRRFERGADIQNVLRAQQRTVDLICELAGGIATEDSIDVYPDPVAPTIVEFRPSRVAEITSLQVDKAEMQRILAGLGFINTGATSVGLKYEVPSWRIDVDQEEDLVEEIARHFGYDKIASELPPSNMSGEYQPDEVKQRLLRRALNGLGFDEAINFSFIPEEFQFELIPAFSGREESQVALQNPIIEDASRMRQTLLPGLLSSVRHNLNHSIRDVRLFEIGRIFATSEALQLPEERVALGAVATGGLLEAERVQAERELDFYDLKGALEAGLDSMNLPGLTFKQYKIKHLRSGQAAAIHLPNGERVGSIGRLSEAVASTYKFRQAVYVLELDLSALFTLPERLVHYTPLARYPSVMRDISLLVDRKVTLQEVVDTINSQAIADCRGVKFVGTYEGSNLPEDKRSISLRIEYRSDAGTLRDEEVERRHAQLTSTLLHSFNAEQR